MNAYLLEMKMKEANISTEKAACETNMDPATFYHKKMVIVISIEEKYKS